jgi:hypothetical protein
MYLDGEDGSDFGPITSSSLEPGSELPSPGGSQYIEAKASGGCALTDSTFVMNFHYENSNATFHFVESNNVWTVNGESFQRINAAGTNFTVAIAQNVIPGNQDIISIVIS